MLVAWVRSGVTNLRLPTWLGGRVSATRVSPSRLTVHISAMPELSSPVFCLSSRASFLGIRSGAGLEDLTPPTGDTFPPTCPSLKNLLSPVAGCCSSQSCLFGLRLALKMSLPCVCSATGWAAACRHSVVSGGRFCGNKCYPSVSGRAFR